MASATQPHSVTISTLVVTCAPQHCSPTPQAGASAQRHARPRFREENEAQSWPVSPGGSGVWLLSSVVSEPQSSLLSVGQLVGGPASAEAAAAADPRPFQCGGKRGSRTGHLGSLHGRSIGER